MSLRALRSGWVVSSPRVGSFNPAQIFRGGVSGVSPLGVRLAMGSVLVDKNSCVGGAGGREIMSYMNST